MHEIYTIKNMVCDRCIASVLTIFEGEGFTVESIELGQVNVVKTEKSNQECNLESLSIQLKKNGFEIIKNDKDTLVEKLKIELINAIEAGRTEQLSQDLALRFGKSYSVLSKLFSKTEGVTLEKYSIQLKIEKVKELIQLGQLNFSEIAYSLNYKTSSHLARQFKMVTGVSMTEYKNAKEWNRKTIDKII
ncbi:helix-turn-helix transcriptional regulator [Bizionia saleffrena]|uniref:Helix-turn-helix transcriptional regulator n=1 Tax=Bizionia saleffrena TaxID=291189 RepID=A0A8H2LEJ8_9FLAO|nr:AraC family transcriptional regulator [Bizionia saleffrena]TYB74451.1 helix-turn-helix transcriptional regulator [Bizionia saleffrena]